MTPKEKAIEHLSFALQIHPNGLTEEDILGAIDIALREQRIIYEKLIRDTVKEVITQTDEADKNEN